MAAKWYPVIDYSQCIQCGICIENCSHGVYDTQRGSSPVVHHPQGCIDGCHGCGNRCPVGAITYVGDNTGWTPGKGKKESKEGACSCGGSCN